MHINACSSFLHFSLSFSSIYPSFVQPACPSSRNSLVANADQVVSQLLDSVGSRAGLNGLGVVRDEDCLRGLDDHNALSALCYEAGSAHLHASLAS